MIRLLLQGLITLLFTLLYTPAKGDDGIYFGMGGYVSSVKIDDKCRGAAFVIGGYRFIDTLSIEARQAYSLRDNIFRADGYFVNRYKRIYMMIGTGVGAGYELVEERFMVEAVYRFRDEDVAFSIVYRFQ